MYIICYIYNFFYWPINPNFSNSPPVEQLIKLEPPKKKNILATLSYNPLPIQCSHVTQRLWTLHINLFSLMVSPLFRFSCRTFVYIPLNEF